MIRRAALGAAFIAVTACHAHAPPPQPVTPHYPAAVLHPRLPVDHAGGWVLAPVHDVTLDTPEERLTLAVLQRHPAGIPRAAVRETAKAIVEEAHAYGLEPSVILGLIRVESTNWNWSRSEHDARGLMQVLPATGREMARHASVVWAGPDSLYDPVVNVRLGTRYLAQMKEEFGSLELALAAYNEGPNRLERRLARGRKPNDDYATTILWFADRYQNVAARGDDLNPGLARVMLALDKIERQIDGKPAVALARFRTSKAVAGEMRSINLNQVTFTDLLLVDPDMTARNARTILDWRAANGGFHSVDELDGLALPAGLTRRLHEHASVSDVVSILASTR